MTVKLYKTTNCPWCVKVATYLEKKGVQFEPLNCSENEEYKQELVNKSHQTSVPVLDIDGQIIIGFDRPRIDAALEKLNS